MPPFKLPKANRPEPLDITTQVWAAVKNTDRKQILQLLLKGEKVLIEDQYPTGLQILVYLKKHIFSKKSPASFKDEREKRVTYRHISNRLLIPVEHQSIALGKAPKIGWLPVLYPDLSAFLLPIPQIQGLNSSWQWYQKGIQYPMINFLVKPYYGVYFPTRFEHLTLFDEWLKRYSNKKDIAMDVGTGCGILTFILLKKGFKNVLATDINPNALISVYDNAKINNQADRISLRMADLFDGCTGKHDLVVFNPPWIPSPKNTLYPGLDDAVYYEDPSFFNRFFAGVRNVMKDESVLVFLFSNFAQLNQLTAYHPVRSEIESRKRFKLIEVKTMGVAGSSSLTKRNDWRRGEEVELWVLKKI